MALDENEKQKIIDKINSYLEKTPIKGTGQDFLDAGIKYNNHPYFLVAIVGAENSFGVDQADLYNIGSYKLTDSACAVKCPNIGFKSYREGIFAMSATLSNNLLGKGTRICDFSQGGWAFCSDAKEKMKGRFYARSLENWHRNVRNFLSELFEKKIEDNQIVKLNHFYKI